MKQITEDYVSFEVAQLLKEKGFPQQEYINTFPYYTQNGNLYFGDINTVRQRYYAEAIAPTQSIALKWLRKKYKIVLDIAFEENQGWAFYVSYLITKEVGDGSTYIVGIQHCVWSDDVQQPYYNEYEEAVEAALDYFLKKLDLI